MVFGLSAAVMSPLYPWLLSRMGYRAMTLALGLIAAGTGLAAAVFIRLPRSPQPASAVPSAGSSAPASLTVRQSLKTRSFWFLWLTWALAGAAGVAMVYLANAFGVARGFSIQKAILLQTAFNLTNGAGRLVSGFASDRWGRNGTLVGIFFLEGNFNLVFTYLGGLYTIAAILVWFVRPRR
jgi:OFA family oxalate/formate antiporter-like MFS transporter